MSALDDAVEDVKDVVAADVANIAALPATDEVRTQDPFGAYLFALSRINPPGSLIEGILGNLARLGKPQYGIPTEHETARLTAKRYRSTNDFVPDGATRDAEAGVLGIPDFNALFASLELPQKEVSKGLSLKRLVHEQPIMKRFPGSTWIATRAGVWVFSHGT